MCGALCAQQLCAQTFQPARAVLGANDSAERACCLSWSGGPCSLACLGADVHVCATPTAGAFDLRPGTFERWQATVQVKAGEAGELQLVPVTAQRLEVPTALA